MHPLIYRPSYRVSMADLTIELWVAQRKIPMLMRADAKIARDYGADRVQYEANKVAPLPPGEAFVGTGARYKYKYTALAVVFDEFKRTSPELITQAINRATRLLRDRGARSVVVPDMTENLLTQPTWITQEQRDATAALLARITVDAIMDAGAYVRNVKIWCWEPANAAFFRKELEALKHRQRAAQ